MRAVYDNQRERSRERNSRDRSYPNNRDGSPQFDPYHRSYVGHQFAKKKRVKFNDQEDIRVFKKQDQPIAKALTEEEIVGVKLQLQKQISRVYDFNWDQKKHFDALSQQNSMKEQKQKEKELYDKLMGMKQQIQFYTPYPLYLSASDSENALQPGSQSIQRQAHTERIKDVLGCYYTQINEIPNQPIFQVSSQTNKNQPKIIKFNPAGVNQSQQFVVSKNKNQKQIKGILKLPGQNNRTSTSKQSQERQITPRLLWLLKEFQTNKEKYNKDMTDLLLKPYKQSGQLDYWMKNPAALNQKLKNQPVGVQPPPSTNFQIQSVSVPTIPNIPSLPRMSPSPSNQFRPQFQYDNQPKTDKFKTIPCKYFHSPQGCVKTQNCTFIHDERYRGVLSPYMNKQNYQQGGSFGGNTGYQQNTGFPRSNDTLQPYNMYAQNMQTQPTGSYGKTYPNQNPNQNMYGNPGSQFSQSGYQSQPNRYQNYGQGGQMQPQHGQQGQMNRQVGNQMNMAPYGQVSQQQPNQGYGGYQNSHYYNKGQGGNMQGRSSNQR